MAFSSTIQNAVQSMLPGATIAQITQHLEDALREFCRRAWVWRETITLSVISGTANYTLVSPQAGTMVAYTLAVELNGQGVAPKEFYFAQSQAPFRWWSKQIGTITFEPTPAQNGTAKIVVAIVPSASNYVLPAMFETMWHETLIAGALARAHATMARPYTNPMLAKSYARRFRSEMTNARAAADAGFGAGQPHVVFPPFA